MGAMGTGQVIGFFVGLIAIIFAAYYVTYFIGKKAQGQNLGRIRNKNINVIDRFAISRDKSFYLVEIAGKVYVVGITNQNITLLDTLDAAAFSKAAAVQKAETKWNTVPGGKYTAGITRKMADFIAMKMGTTPPSEEVSRFESFSDSMKAANNKRDSGAQGEEDPEQKDNPEEL